MKKIFTLMLTFACAMFVGVSCTTDGPADNGGGTTPPAEPTYDVVITVGELAEALPATGGTAELSVTLSKEVIGASLVAESSATWLSASVNEDNELVLTASPFQAVTAPRTAEVVVSYVDSNNNNLAAPVTVDASQNSQTPQFSVTWSDKTPVGATATITITDTSKEGMIWGAFTFGQSALEPSDDDDFMPWSTRAGAATKTPEEYAMEQIANMLAPDPVGYGFTGLYSGFYWLPQYSKPYFLSELNETVLCSLVSSSRYGSTVEKKGYLAVVGINKNNANLETDVDDSTQATVIHIFEVEALPAPTVSVSVSEAEVNATEGCQPVTITVENPYNGVLSAYVDYSAESWVATSMVDNKLHINYAENPYAVSRSTEVTVNYTYVCEVLQYGMLMPMDINATATVKLTQKKNETVAPVTFELEVVETHFDHILVNVTPSDLNATYVLGNIQQMGFDESYEGDWNDLVASQANNEALTGAQTNYRLDVDRWGNEDDSDPESWKYWVYAFAVDTEKGVPAGEASKTLVAVTNDRPGIACPEGFAQTDNTEYTLDVYGKGGEYSVKLEAVNPPADGYCFKLFDYTTYERVDESTVTDENYNYGSLVFGNEQKVAIKDGYLTFTVNDFSAEKWTETYAPVSSFSLYLTNADNTKVHGVYTIRVRLHPAQE